MEAEVEALEAAWELAASASLVRGREHVRLEHRRGLMKSVRNKFLQTWKRDEMRVNFMNIEEGRDKGDDDPVQYAKAMTQVGK